MTTKKAPQSQSTAITQDDIDKACSKVLRHVIIFFFDCQKGNINGDPDNANLPRTWPDGTIEVSPPCQKRKVRTWLEVIKGLPLYLAKQVVLNNVHEQIYSDLGLDKATRSFQELAATELARRFIDARMFGAVASTGKMPIANLTGPIQVGWAGSVNRPQVKSEAITRMCIASEAEEETMKGANRTFGRPAVMRYGLFRGLALVSPLKAARTGLSEADVDLFCMGLRNMFGEQDEAAGRGLCTVRHIFDFQSNGNAAAFQVQDLIARIKVEPRPSVEDPVCFDDFVITVDRNLPAGVTLVER